MKKCDGGCEQHEGEVRAVKVYGTACPEGWDFDYCRVAIAEDENRGFVVTFPAPTITVSMEG